MKIKKYTAGTEQEAIEKVKDELGLDALVLNIKRIQPKGIMSFFKKAVVEITAAYDDKKEEPLLFKEKTLNYDAEEKIVEVKNNNESIILEAKNKTISYQKEKIENLEQKLNSAEDMMQKAISNLTIENQIKHTGVRKYENSMIQLFYEVLVNHGVTEEIASKILEEVTIIEDDIDINFIVKVVYNKIITILGGAGEIELNKCEDGNPKVLAFFGPTGVGKTTTIAKLTSNFVLNKNLNVGLITADTYRIAAVEQLKTYADILGLEVGVAYTSQDLSDNYENMKNLKDVILIDTAGRSHRNNENIKELEKILSVLPKCNKFLVLSTTTKYEDLVSIINSFSSISEFEIIFTKLDETTSLGSVLNISYLLGKKIMYTTFGQNIPDDIEIIKPGKIARSLLGLGGDTF
jgi:flagellar biosynthesis protein FlhF